MLINSASAIKITSAPDVFGPNGVDYTNFSADQDLAQIGIDILAHGKGDKCQPGLWATVKYKGTLKDGRVITDSDSEAGFPTQTFSVGSSYVYRCWDLALPQLQAGTKAHISCPAHLVYGSASVYAPFGDDHVPKNSEVDFDLEV